MGGVWEGRQRHVTHLTDLPPRAAHTRIPSSHPLLFGGFGEWALLTVDRSPTTPDVETEYVRGAVDPLPRDLRAYNTNFPHHGTLFITCLLFPLISFLSIILSFGYYIPCTRAPFRFPIITPPTQYLNFDF